MPPAHHIPLSRHSAVYAAYQDSINGALRTAAQHLIDPLDCLLALWSTAQLGATVLEEVIGTRQQIGEDVQAGGCPISSNNDSPASRALSISSTNAVTCVV